MKNWFQNKPTSGDTASITRGDVRLHLAAFGKHPGWEDHIPGIGLTTDGLVHVKQTLYVAGIGGQINSGAWKNLEPEKRVPGFDHWFLWRRAGALCCGRLWSSQDRTGRKEYPMVLCVEAAGFPAALLLSKAWPEIDRLRGFCQEVDVAATVTAECAAAQERLRNAMSNASGSGTMDLQIKRSFLEHPDLGPDRVGWLRALHEIDRVAAPGRSKEGPASTAYDSSQSHHWRVPRACPTDGGGLLLWFDFLTRSLSGNTPLLLITRINSGWVEVIVGEPQTADLFCLQASRVALPLATEIPYEQHWEPDTKSRLQSQLVTLEARFLGDSQTQVISRPESKPTSGRPSTSVARSGDPDAKPPGRPLRWVLLILVVVMVGGLGLWLATQRKAALPHASPVTQHEDSETNPVDAAVVEKPSLDPQYAEALAASQKALDAGQWQEALDKAGEALVRRPGDAAATTLKADAQSRLMVDTNFAAALEAAQAAFAGQQWQEAVAKADEALRLHPQDSVATKLKADAQARLTEDQGYAVAIKAAQDAMAGQQWQEAMSKAQEGLTHRPGDAAATKIKQDAQQRLTDASAQRRYDQAMTDARAAFEGERFAVALQQADAALSIRPGDPGAQELKARAGQLQQAQRARQQFEQAMAEGNQAFNRKDYAMALQQATEALRLKSGDEAAAALKAKATSGAELQKATALFDAGDYEAALGVCAGHPSEPAFTELTARIEMAGKQATQNQLEELDLQLQTLLVRFNVVSADSDYIRRAEAKQTPRLSGRLSPQDVDAYLAQIDRLEAGFKQGGWLNENERERYLKKLRSTIFRAQ